MSGLNVSLCLCLQHFEPNLRWFLSILQIKPLMSICRVQVVVPILADLISSPRHGEEMSLGLMGIEQGMFPLDESPSALNTHRGTNMQLHRKKKTGMQPRSENIVSVIQSTVKSQAVNSHLHTCERLILHVSFLPRVRFNVLSKLSFFH